MLLADHQLSLLVIGGVQQGKRVPLPRLPFLIGRGSECHLRPVSPVVASRHCVLLERNDCLMLADLGSTNGTFVNGVRLEGSIVVGDGDLLVIGPLRFRLRVEARQPFAESSVEETAAEALLDGAAAPAGPPEPVAAPSVPLMPLKVRSRRKSSPAAAARAILSRMLRNEKQGRS